MDLNVQAFRLVQEATSDTVSNRAKLASSRKGGLSGGPARAKALSKEQRQEIARKANMARWSSPTA
jgi:hypothetical protein